MLSGVLFLIEINEILFMKSKIGLNLPSNTEGVTFNNLRLWKQNY